ncbi:MAG: glycosyltransferase family 39 protein [Anaerolineae bacterium]|nr:glycosyltransferase family 39 protein [Anaerolineae bacterium]
MLEAGSPGPKGGPETLPPPARLAGMASPGWLAELAWVGVILAMALLVRWPYLQQVPRFNDEVTIWRVAVDIQDNGARPLVFEDTGYNGPLLIYLLAALRSLSPAIEAPRLLALVIGCASVLAMYLLGRALAGRWAGLIAAALFAVTLTPAVVYGHVLHMVGLAVLLQILGWWAAVCAVNSGKGVWLVVAGACTGLAAQTHPLSAVFVPGLLVWLALQPTGRRLLRGRWGLLTLAAMVIAYLPLLAYHLPALLGRQGSRLLGSSEGIMDSSGLTGLDHYAAGVANLLASLGDVVSSARHDAATPIWADSLALLLGGLIVASLIFTARRGQWLPLCLAASAVLCMPLLVTSYDNTLLGRYSGLALPVFHLAIGVAAALLLTGDTNGAPAWTAPRTLAVALLVAVALGGLGLRLAGYYAIEAAANRTNSDLFAVLADVERSGQPVTLDGAIKRTNGQGTGPSGVLQGMFAWRGIEVKKLSAADKIDNYLRAIAWPTQVIVSDAMLRQIDQRGRLDLAPSRAIAPISDVEGWGLYSFTPAPKND